MTPAPEIAPSPQQVFEDLTPHKIVRALDRHIVGQDKAKKMVAIALRNRTRRQRLDDEIREEINPKNIILMGPTGVGKTEIARRLARLVNAPFIKVEATKYTEIGYVGRDVESMVRDLVDRAVAMIRERCIETIRGEARTRARNRLIDLLAKNQDPRSKPGRRIVAGYGSDATATIEDSAQGDILSRKEIARLFDRGDLDDRGVEIDLPVRHNLDGMVGMIGVDESMLGNMREMMDRIMPQRNKPSKMTVAEAKKVLVDLEIEELLDMDKITREAIDCAEQSGIIFIDEIDKIAGREGGAGPDVSRQGVQRDILPIVEGCTVRTKYGLVKTDHILFMAAGAFHTVKPSDLIPELQGRFPLRVELSSLSTEDFKRILTEPDHSLVEQYKALLQTDGVILEFTDDSIEELAQAASTINDQTENIGARRLHTILERVLQDVAFDAPEAVRGEVIIDRAYVRSKLEDLLKDQDLSRFIL